MDNVKQKNLIEFLLTCNNLQLYDIIGISFPSARLNTLNTFKGHPVLYQCSREKLCPTIKTNMDMGVVVDE